MDIHKVMSLLPHRYPFLLVDRVLDYQSGNYLHAIKNVTINEPYFTGHFPIKPVMPGVLILEALAQATGLLAMETQENYDGSTLYYLVGIDKARFKQPVVPGDQLHLNVSLIKERRNIWVFDCKATVDDKVVASAEIMCSPREI